MNIYIYVLVLLMCDVWCCVLFGIFRVNKSWSKVHTVPPTCISTDESYSETYLCPYVAILGRTCQTSSPLSPLSDSSSPNKASRRLPSRNVKQFNFSDKKTQVQFIWFVDYRLNRLYIQARNICKSTTTTTVYFTLKAPGILIDRQNRNINKSKTPYQQ